MDQAIEDCICQCWISNVLMPVIDGHLTRNQRAPSIISIIEQFQQVPSVFVVKWRDAPVVQDQKIRLGENAEPGIVSAIMACCNEIGKQPAEPLIACGAPLPYCLLGEGAGKITLAYPCRAGNEAVAPTAHPLACG